MPVRRIWIRFTSLAAALALTACLSTPALAAESTSFNQGPCIGQGDSHDKAYNSAYTTCRINMNFTCGLAGGRLADVAISTEADFDYGHNFFQVMLTLRASCVKTA